MKILVPIDFSKASDWGFYYAYNLAVQLDAQLIAVHLYRPPYVESTMPERIIKEVLSQKEQEMTAHLYSNTQPPLKSKANVQIERLLVSAALHDIVSLSKEHQADLIIMGTHGADGAFDKLLGTNTSNVVEFAPCPVIAVPSGTNFSEFSCIAYALNFEDNDFDNIEDLVALATLTKAKVHCIHVNVVGETDDDKEKEAQFRLKFAEKFADNPLVTYTTRSAMTIEDGLESFLRFNEVSVLAMQPRKRGFWSRMFGDSSVTREMVLRANLPILAFHK
jgi:nucleotide-binding universal stress UspA family protein